jgi:Protein of unknown function (DUF2878)
LPAILSHAYLLSTAKNSSNNEAGSAVTRPALLKLVLFQIVWLSCAIGAGQGWSLPGIFAAAILIAFHLVAAPQWRPATMAVLLAGTFGLVAENLLVGSGLVRYSAPWPTEALAPAWIVALWLAFGTTLETTRRLLGSHLFVKSAFLGLALGPLSYLAGGRLGALEFSQPAWLSYLGIAMVWGIALPALLAVDEGLGHGARR